MKPDLTRPGAFEIAAWFFFALGAFFTWYMPHELTRLRYSYADDADRGIISASGRETLLALRIADQVNPFGHGPMVMVVSVLAAGIMRTQRHCAIAIAHTLEGLRKRPAAPAQPAPLPAPAPSIPRVPRS